MNCAECKDLLVPYLEGLLDDSEGQAVPEHVKDCVGCRTELEGLATLQQRLVGNGKALEHSDLEDNVMNRIFREQNARLKSATQAGAALRIRRLIMKSSTVKIAVAAAVILACLAALHLWHGTESGVALADVLVKVEQVEAFIYRMTMHGKSTAQNMATTDIDIQGTTLIANEYGFKLDMHTVDPNMGLDMEQQMYLLPKQKVMMIVMPKQKKYMRVELDDTMLDETRQQNNDPRLMIRQIMGCEYEELGESVIDGVEVKGFRTTDPAYGAGMFGDVDVTLWVDVKTRLPVRVDMYMKASEQIQMRGTLHDFQWNVPVSASEFNPVLPADFTAGPGDGIKMPARNEETAIEGLRRWLDLLGRYPENLNMMNLVRTMGDIKDSTTPEGQRLQQELADVQSPDERSEKLMEAMMPIQAVGGFYATLVREQKEPAYYGETVTPGDVAQVLLRWKTGENEYRVIFADLHAETVTAEALARLEAALPK